MAGILVRLFIPTLILVVLFTAMTDRRYIDTRTRKTFIALCVLETVLFVSEELEMYCASLAEYTPWRTFLSVVCYIIRPFLLMIIIDLSTQNQLTRKQRLIYATPAIFNAVVMVTAFFCPIAFYFGSDNTFHRGTLGYEVFVVAIFYYCLLTYTNYRYSWEFSIPQRIIVTLISIAFFVGMSIEFMDSEGTTRVMENCIAICTLIYFMLWQSTKMQLLVKDLNQSINRNEIVVAHSGKSMVVYDLRQRILTDQTNLHEVFGIPKSVSLADEPLRIQEIVAPESQEEFGKFFAGMHEGVFQNAGRFKMLRKNKTWGWYQVDYTLQNDSQGQPIYSILSMSDVTAQQEQKLALEQSRAAFMQLINNCDFYLEGGLVSWTVEQTGKNTDTGKRILSKLEALDGAEAPDFGEVLKILLLDDVLPEDREVLKNFLQQERIRVQNVKNIITEKMEFRLTDEQETTWWQVEIFINQTPLESNTRLLITFRNVDVAHHSKDELERRANIDALTGLRRRATTMQEITEYLEGQGATGDHALLMVDMDNLKRVNDLLGHQAGDQALKDFADELVRFFRTEDILGRIGGDEFFVFLKNISPEMALRKTQQMVEHMVFTYGPEGNQVTTTASAGIALYCGYDANRKNLETLYAEADEALYRAKASGKHACRVHKA